MLFTGGVPGTLRAKTFLASIATPKIGMMRLPGPATGVGTVSFLSLLPSIRTVKKASLCSEFEPSGSTKVKKPMVSLSMNRG
jgi:hypothetical protein